MEELSSHLRSNGLDDYEFWLEQLKKLGVQSKESLALLEGEMDDFKELKAEARNRVEEKALRKLLKMDKLDKKKEVEGKKKTKERKDRRQKQKQEAKEKQTLEAKQESEEAKKELKAKEDKAQAILTALEKASSAGLKRNDERVQKLESDIRKHLQVSPESWLSSDKSLTDLIQKLEERQKISANIRTRDWQSDGELLKKCSGGRALNGVFLTKQPQDQLEAKFRLLEVPENVSITGNSTSEDKIEQFSSQHQEDQYTKLVEIFGHGVSVSSSIPVYGSFAITLGVSESEKTENESTHKKSTKEMYSSTVKYSSMQVANFSFERKDLKLSEDAKTELKEVLKMLKVDGGESTRVQEACKQFFNKFGSHANRGPLSFGGNFWWTCSSRGFSENETQTVKEMQSVAIEISAGVSFAGVGVSTSVSIEETTGSYEGKCSAHTRASTTLNVKITGGPPEATDLDLWKSGLVASNSTWILTDRGRKFIAVWEIIKMNHEQELGGVRDVLRKTWEEVTGLTAVPDYSAVLSHDPDTILEEVSEWIEDETSSPEQIEKNLEYLLKVKRDTIKETNQAFWISEFILQPSMLDFLLLIVELELDSPQLKHIKFLMQQLIEEDEVSQLNAREFRLIEQVFKWLYAPSLPSTDSRPAYESITDFESFTSFLRKTLDDAHIAALRSDDLEHKATSELANNVSKAINRLRFHCKQSYYEEVFVVALVSPFLIGGESDITTLRPISVKDLELLHDRFNTERQTFLERQEKPILKLQVYLMQLVTNQCQKKQVGQQLQQLRRMIDHIQPPLEQELTKALDSYFHGSTLGTLKQTLRSLMTAAPKPKHKPNSGTSNTKSLLLVLKTPVQPEKKLSKSLSSVCQGNPDALALLKKLGLHKHYPKGLMLQDALSIKPEPLKLSLGKESPADPEKLPDLILHKLMAYDSLCRSELMLVVEEDEDDLNSIHSYDSEQESDNESDEESFHNKRSDHTSDGLHPVDSLLSLIICSDDFLRQDLFSRLAKCQLAVPFILPDPFTKELALPLWGLRSIIKEWECTEASGEVVKKMQPIISYKMPLVTFIRLGKHQEHVRSKSAILNEVISDSHYDHFFHRDCPGGGNRLVLGDGLVDMCWYLPGETATAFPDAVTFLNLHGDAREHPEQMRFLSQISSMCFVLLTEEDLELDDVTRESLEQFGSTAGGITLLGSTKNIPKIFKKKAFIDLKKKNVSALKDAIRSRINRKVEFSQQLQSIEDCCSAEEGVILIDEHSESYRQGLAHATELRTLITSHQTQISTPKAKPGKKNGRPSLKDALLPLQGDTLWKAWAANDKEKQRQILRGNKSVNQYTEDIKSKKVAIRKRQLEHIKSLTPVMESFIVSLLRFGGPFNRIFRNYFLQCLKLELNNLSRESISDMQYQYQSVRKELSELQEETTSQDNRAKSLKIDSLKRKLEDLQENIISSSLGLEHFLRELGQVYEAAASEPQLYRDSLNCLPKAAAELLIDGYPLELMDGDAAHVPLQWVTAVLKETTKMLGDPNVFVLSVLGLQSTGKSTMLNTVFGVQFNVSAGRCTRGAFIQLLPLGDELRALTKCSYILVVDTEGLRAPELDPLKTQKHDNELATFVIGLANVTLINIYGEVPGDMDDILQTSVHAFLRMTQVKFSPSCQFVHQNAGTNVSSEVGRAKFTKKLNQFTIAAAEHESCDEKFKCFSDVIKFNDQSDVHHFPGLWKGDPPMAPVNQGYSQSAQKLKLHLIEILSRRSTAYSSEERTSDLHLSAFQVKVQSLWKALLQENFVFSFKNTQEVTAYNSLETEYSSWDWELRNPFQNWERVAENEINAKEAEAALELAKEKCKELPKHMAILLKPITAKMKEFFSGKQSEILVQWKAKFEKRLENLKEELMSHAEKHCMKIGKSKKAISKFEKQRKNYEATVTAQVKEHIAVLKKELEDIIKSLKIRRLTAHQSEKIIQRKIFTPESLQAYKDQGIVTEDQVRAVQAVIDGCGGKLTTADLQKIMFGEVFGLEQVKKILIKGRQTEEALEMKFSDIWNDLITQLSLESHETVNVEMEVERKLTEFARSHGYEDLLIAIMQASGKPLRKWGTRLEVTLDKTHYTKPVTKTVKHWFYGGGETLLAAQVMTENVFDKARECLRVITEEKTDFNSGFVSNLLRQVDTAITEESEAVKDQLTITHKCRYTMLLVVCGHAIPKFEEMARTFLERIDPRLYLEKHLKKPLFTMFKTQYYQTEAEEAIASTLCALLEVPIKDQIKKTIGPTMVERMKASKHHFTSKMALKVKVLVDLYKEDTYDSFMAYARSVKGYLQDRIEQYTVQYASERVSGKTRLQMLAKEEVSRLVTVVENAITEVNEAEIQEWLTNFSENQKLVKELSHVNVDNLLTGFDSLTKINLENFKSQIRIGLQELKKGLHATYDNIKCEEDMTQWQDKPHELLANLIGCTEQCPFCGEQCDLLDPDHYEDNKLQHRIEVHRPSCLAGYGNHKTRVMSSDFCTTDVSSGGTFCNAKTDGKFHPYKEYQSIYPEWSIPPDPSSESCLYWKWFVGKYAKNLAETYNAKPANVPSSWLNIKWPEVARSLEEAYNVQVPL